MDQRRLRDVRVLVLVQDHAGVSRAVLLGRLGEPLDDVEGERDLVSEVDHADVSLQLPEPGHGPGQLDSLERGLIRSIAAMARQCGQPFLVELDDSFRPHAMVGRLIGQLEDLADQRRLPFRAHVLEHHPVQDPGAQLDALGRREHALARLDPGQEAVSLEHLGGEPVVVRDGGLFPLGEVQARESPADAQDQVLGGLVGEGQAKHVAREHAHAVGAAVDAAQGHQGQVHDPGGHDRGLARAGPGHHHVGLQRHGDGPPLLLGGVCTAHDPADLLRICRGGPGHLLGPHVETFAAA